MNSFNLRLALTLVVIASMVVADTIDVGGPEEHWRSGSNYIDWSIKHGPFYHDDILVFKYDPPSANTSAHNVYLFPDLWSYISCDFGQARLLASETQGAAALAASNTSWLIFGGPLFRFQRHK